MKKKQETKNGCLSPGTPVPSFLFPHSYLPSPLRPPPDPTPPHRGLTGLTGVSKVALGPISKAVGVLVPTSLSNLKFDSPEMSHAPMQDHRSSYGVTTVHSTPFLEALSKDVKETHSNNAKSEPHVVLHLRKPGNPKELGGQM